jgi:hypothetical protein
MDRLGKSGEIREIRGQTKRFRKSGKSGDRRNVFCERAKRPAIPPNIGVIYSELLANSGTESATHIVLLIPVVEETVTLSAYRPLLAHR